MSVSTACNRTLGNNDINKVTIACKPIEGEWDELGQYLNVTSGVIKTIKADNGDSARRLMDLISTWVKRQRKEDRPSWRKLCEALKHIDEILAEKIAGEHQCSHGDCKVSIFVPKEISDDTMGEIGMPVSTACNRVLGNEDINEVTIACKPIKGEWDQLGQYLNVSSGAIKTIKADNGDSAGRLMGLISTWVKRERKENRPSWRKLCEALENFVEGELAEKIAGEHQCSHGDCKETTYEGGIKESGSQLSIEVKAPELALVNVGGSKKLSANIFSIPDVWELEKIRSTWGWNGYGTKTAILDTAVDPVCLNKVINYIDCLQGMYIPSVSIQHGTICAAVAAGQSYSWIDSSTQQTYIYPGGIAPEADLIVYRVADGSESFHNSAILQALQHIHNNLQNTFVDVVSMSFDFKGGSAGDVVNLHKIIEDLSRSGVILVAAAGNNGMNQARAKMPASIQNVISVGALDRYGYKSCLSPPSGLIDVFVPGEDIPVPLSSEVVQGTSFATAAVAGLVSLMVQCVKQSFPGNLALIKRLSEPEVLKRIFNHHMIKCIPQQDGKTVDRVLDPCGFFEHINEDKTWLETILLEQPSSVDGLKDQQMPVSDNIVVKIIGTPNSPDLTSKAKRRRIMDQS